MAESRTTSFRFPQEFHDLLDRVAGATGATRNEVMQRSVEWFAGLLFGASRESYDVLGELRRRYGGDARIDIVVALENERPVAHLMINNKVVDDVKAQAYVDVDAGKAHVHVSVSRGDVRTPEAVHLKVGDEVLFVSPSAWLPVGALPWPPRPRNRLVLDLAEVPDVPGEPAVDVAAD